MTPIFQIFFAIGIPIDIPDKSVSLSFYFEANYVLSDGDTFNNIDEYFLTKKLNRKLAYDIFQNKFEKYGVIVINFRYMYIIFI